RLICLDVGSASACSGLSGVRHRTNGALGAGKGERRRSDPGGHDGGARGGQTEVGTVGDFDVALAAVEMQIGIAAVHRGVPRLIHAAAIASEQAHGRSREGSASSLPQDRLTVPFRSRLPLISEMRTDTGFPSLRLIPPPLVNALMPRMPLLEPRISCREGLRRTIAQPRVTPFPTVHALGSC